MHSNDINQRQTQQQAPNLLISGVPSAGKAVLAMMILASGAANQRLFTGGDRDGIS